MTGHSLESLGLGALGALLDVHPSNPSKATLDAGRELDHLKTVAAELGDRDGWPESLRRAIDEPVESDRVVIALGRYLDLEPIELLTFAVALAVEHDALAGRAIARLQAPVATAHPTLGLLERAFQPFFDGSDGSARCAGIAGGVAVHTGTIELDHRDAPLPEQIVRVPDDLVLALAGVPDRSSDDDAGIALFESAREIAARHADVLARDGGVLLVRSSLRSEARAAASAVCDAAGREPCWCSPAQPSKSLAAVCFVREQWPVFELDLAPGERRQLPSLPGHRGPIIAMSGIEGHVHHPTMPTSEWHIDLPNPGQRSALWATHLEDDSLAADLAVKYLHGAGRIAEIAELARRRARFEQRERAGAMDVIEAAWSSESSELSGLTQPIRSRVGDSALVVNSQLRAELEFLVSRCRNREGLGARLGETIQATYHTGVRALFVGASGTGKTLAASWLATRLGMPLYRVDLASVVSKYIGETEKNLANLLGQAEQSDVILLFDEADSMFAKRTDVKDANDRHANTQTNYLLQRIESYRGIVVLTSNSKSRFDKAFARRLDTVIEFALPTPELRRRMWTAHLGNRHELSHAELNQLAVETSLAGGQIRNAVLGAAVLANERHEPITFTDVLTAVVDEYRKLGQQPPVKFNQRLAEISTEPERRKSAEVA